MSYPIDFGDSDSVVQQLLEAGALQNVQANGNGNIGDHSNNARIVHVFSNIGNKLYDAMKRVGHGFLQEDCPSTSTVLHTHLPHKIVAVRQRSFEPPQPSSTTIQDKMSALPPPRQSFTGQSSTPYSKRNLVYYNPNVSSVNGSDEEDDLIIEF